MQRLPREILNLFPMWEYRCPKCGVFLGYESIDYCVKCGSTFSHLKARVPPRLLKDDRLMSEYAHKVLAPKLSRKARELLFKYFTIIFEDGFESGNFDAWTDQTGSPTVVSEDKHHGTYCMKASGSTTQRTNKEGLTGGSTRYGRIYVKFSSGLPDDDGDYVTILMFKDSGDLIADCGVKRVSGNVEWYAQYKDGTDSYVSFETSGASISTGTWYYVELGVYANTSSAGWLKLYIDSDAPIIDESNLDYRYDTISRFHVGIVGISGVTTTLYVDCAKVADERIGMHDDSSVSSKCVIQKESSKGLSSTFYRPTATYFDDGFEDEDDNFNTNWDGKYETDAGCSCTIDTTRPKFGSKCAKGTTDGVYKSAFAYKDWGTGLSEIWVRNYVNLENLPSSGICHFHLAIRDTNNNVIVQEGFRRATGDGVYQCVVWNQIVSESYLSGSITLNADTWYCYETRLKRGDTDGEVQVWLDGVSEINVSSKDTSLGYDYDNIQCGNRASEEACTIYVDAVVVSDARIGSADETDLSSTFYTSIFSDGFESGNFNAWSWENEDPGCSADPVSDIKHTGSYGAKFYIDNTYEEATVVKNFGGNRTDLYIRFYARTNTLPTSYAPVRFACLKDNDGNEIVGLRLNKQNGAVEIQAYNHVASEDYWSGSQPIVANKFYCYEFRVKRGSTDGEVEVWFDGSKVIDVDSKNTADTGDYYSRILIGNYISGILCTTWADCVVVSQDYVGPEPEYDLPSTFNAGPLWIVSVQAVPDVVVRTGVNTTELRCDWHDEADLAASAYYCTFLVREPDNSTTYGPFKGSVTKEGSKEYNATYDCDPQDGWALGDYDVQAEVYK